MSEVRDDVQHAVGKDRGIRLIGLLDALGVPRSSWYRRGVPEGQKKPPGPPPRPIPDEVVRWVVDMSVEDPWYGYKRIAVMCRRAGQRVNTRQAYRVMKQFGLLERFHRTLKEEELYWRLYDSPEHCRTCLAEFRQRYNGRRPHWALVPEAGGDPVTPEDVYVGGVRTRIPKWQGCTLQAPPGARRALVRSSHA